MGDIHNIKLYLILAMILLVSTNVLAFAISAPYSKDNPLRMYAGETRDVSFVMQNLQGDSDASVVVSLSEGKEIAQITSGVNYVVPLGTSDTRLNLRIIIPSDASAGATYNVKFSAQSSPVGKEGNIQVGVGYNVDFPVVVLEKSTTPTSTPEFIEQPQEKSTGMMWAIILIVAIIIVVGAIIWFVKRKKQFK